jgi:hypothetical protein
MLLATLLTALQPAGPAPEDARLACAPRLVMTAGGPPPPIFHAQRIDRGPERRVFLSAHDCGGGDKRVERRRTGPGVADTDLEWVPVSHCPAIGAWIESTTRLRLPAPMLTHHVEPRGPRIGTTFTLDARTETGPGWVAHMRLTMLEPPDVPPNALSAWFREGERVFQACRDQGHGGSGYAPGFRRPRP